MAKSSPQGAWLIVVAILAQVLDPGLVASSALAAGKKRKERFSETEIRVIRPRYFTKRKRFELGTKLQSVMNESFIYTFLGEFVAGYHFNEYFAVEGDFAYGTSIAKENKRILFDEFDINTSIKRTQYIMAGNLVVTPVYGKWQLPDGDLIYFDTFFDIGVGQTGIDWQYSDFCEKATASDPPLPPDTTIAYQTILLGVGQRYYISKDSAVRWDIKGHFITYNGRDELCNPTAAEDSSARHESITFAIGMSRFL